MLFKKSRCSVWNCCYHDYEWLFDSWEYFGWLASRILYNWWTDNFMVRSSQRVRLTFLYSNVRFICCRFVLWSLFVFDTPAGHPRISVDELNFIEKSIGSQSSGKVAFNLNCRLAYVSKISLCKLCHLDMKVKVPTPWKAIFKSMPFWVSWLRVL